jgi:hypothetical protein
MSSQITELPAVEVSTTETPLAKEETSELTIEELFKQLNTNLNKSLEETRVVGDKISDLQNKIVKLTMSNARKPSPEANDVIQDVFMELVDAKDDMIKAQGVAYTDLNTVHLNEKQYHINIINDLQKKLTDAGVSITPPADNAPVVGDVPVATSAPIASSSKA